MEHRRRIWRAIQLVVRILPSALTLQAAGTVRTTPRTNQVRQRTEPACNTAPNNIRLLPVSLRPSAGADLQYFLFSCLQSFVVFKSLPKVFKSLPKVGLDNSQADSPFSSCMVCAAATAASLDSYLPSQGLTTGTSICFVIQPHSIVAAIDRINANTLFITKPLFSFAWPSSVLRRRRTDRQSHPCRTHRRFSFRLFVFLFQTTAVSCLFAYPADNQ